MSLKRSESSERARQTGSTALKGTSRNAPKAIKRLSHISDDDAFLDVPFCRELPGVLKGGSGRPPWAQPPHRTLLAGRFRPRSGSIYQSLNILAVPTLQQHPSAQCAVTVQAHDPPEHRLFPSRLSGLRRRGRRRAGCRAVAERSGRGGKGPRMRCWSKWPVGQSDPIGYWLVAAAVLEPEPLPTVVITTTTKGRWRIKGGE
jgi:hypothetical protein